MRYWNSLMLGAVAMAATAMPAGAVTTVLTFDDVACTGADGGTTNRLCTAPNNPIGIDYGSTAQLAVSYDPSIVAGQPNQNSLRFGRANLFTNGMVELATGAFAFPQGPELSEIIFSPLAGFEVAFKSFDFFKLTGTGVDFEFEVADAMGNIIYSLNNSNFSAVRNSATVNSAYFSAPLTFRFGNGGSGVAVVDNIAVDVRAIAVAPGVPEPASWAMMIIGFGTIGVARRRRGVARLAA